MEILSAEWRPCAASGTNAPIALAIGLTAPNLKTSRSSKSIGMRPNLASLCFAPPRQTWPPTVLAQRESGNSLPPRCCRSSSCAAIVAFSAPVIIAFLTKKVCPAISCSMFGQVTQYWSAPLPSSKWSSADAMRAFFGGPGHSG
eukprot:8616360-Pyramimonas_sp.AAC.1